MKTYALKEANPSSSDIVWAFDLGKGPIGEAVRRGNEFVPKASLSHHASTKREGMGISPEFAVKKKGRAKRPVWKSSFPSCDRSGSALPNLS